MKGFDIDMRSMQWRLETKQVPVSTHIASYFGKDAPPVNGTLKTTPIRGPAEPKAKLQAKAHATAHATAQASNTEIRAPESADRSQACDRVYIVDNDDAHIVSITSTHVVVGYAICVVYVAMLILFFLNRCSDVVMCLIQGTMPLLTCFVFMHAILEYITSNIAAVACAGFFVLVCAPLTLSLNIGNHFSAAKWMSHVSMFVLCIFSALCTRIKILTALVFLVFVTVFALAGNLHWAVDAVIALGTIAMLFLSVLIKRDIRVNISLAV